MGGLPTSTFPLKTGILWCQMDLPFSRKGREEQSCCIVYVHTNNSSQIMCSCNRLKLDESENEVWEKFPWGRELIDLIREPDPSPPIEYWANFVCRFNVSRGRHTEEELSHSQLLQKRICQADNKNLNKTKPILNHCHRFVAHWLKLDLA